MSQTGTKNENSDHEQTVGRKHKHKKYNKLYQHSTNIEYTRVMLIHMTYNKSPQILRRS